MTLTRLYTLCIFVAGSTFPSLNHGAEAETVHDPAIHVGAGLKKELIAGISEADFLKLGEKPEQVKLVVIAGYTEENHGMNFNGFSHGNASYVIPLGWTVEVTFINPSPVPHSAIVIERDMLRKVQVGEPFFKGASTPNPISGVSTGKMTFTFVADEPGEYALACGIPTHASAGHWIAMTVSANAKEPTLSLGGAEAKVAK